MEQTSLGKAFTASKHLPLSDRIATYYSFLKSADRLPQVTRVSVKSKAKALEYKKLGNDYYFRSKFIDALKWYTKSAAVALPGSTELAFAYANRSAVLLELNRTKACLVDINRALKENSPETLKQKLRDRKKRCSTRVLEDDRTLLKIMKLFEKLEVDDDGTMQTEMKFAEKECTFDVNATHLNYDHTFFLPETNFKNKTIPNASEKVEIKYSSEFGHHIVAVKNITPGEIIAIEKPYSSVVSWEKTYNHCSNCFVKCEALMPCPNCSEVLFCSKRCLEDAFNKFHRIECEILSLSGYPVTTNLEWKVVRLLMIVTKQGKELESLMAHPLYKNPLKPTTREVPDHFDSQDYVNIHNLLDHQDKRNDFDLWMAIHMTANLVHILKHTTFFEEQLHGNNFSLEEKEKYLSELILKFIFLKSQTQEISEFHEWLMKWSGSKRMIGIGSGFYSFHSLFNHACNANILKTFHKDTIVTYAITPIKTGEQLFVNYGKSYEFDPRKQRQKFLIENYFFTCKCTPCKQNWPVYVNLVSAESEIKKSKKLKQHAKEMNKWFGGGTIQSQHSLKLFKLLSDHITLLYKNTSIPNWEYYNYQGEFYRMLCARGNYYSLECDDLIGSL